MGISPRPRPRPGFETFDLNLASFLRCRGFKIQDVCESSRRTAFVFQDSPELRAAVLDYANDGPIGVRSFCNTLRDLKALTRDVEGMEWRSLGKE